MDLVTIRKKFGSLNSETGGQVFVLFLMVAVVLVMLIGVVYNVGNAIGEKKKLQNLADCCAYSQAVWEARSYNYLAYTNRAMIAHFCTISFCVAIGSCEELWKKLKDYSFLYEWIPYGIGPLLKAIVTGVHAMYKALDTVLNPAVPNIIKIVNPIHQAAQLTFFNSMRLSLLASDIQKDLIKRTEELNFKDYTLEGFDKHTVELVNPLYALGIINEQNYSNIVRKDGFQFPKNFNMLKDLIEKSQDKFADGKHFPRDMAAEIVPWLFKAGFDGTCQIKKDKFYQKDQFGLWIKSWSWRKGFYWKTIAALTGDDEFKYDLKNFRYPVMEKKNKIKGSPGRRSVWSVLKQPKKAITQFPVMLGITEPEDIYAISRAEVYYKHPSKSIGKDPSLFNAYWHAKLAPVYDDSLEYTTLDKGIFWYLIANGYVGIAYGSGMKILH
ncbi:MAG: Tad domain-containing protein [Candidatus Aureabacteria bacterium]|nr:Tad domain-containing protein [Candidatus Auribacterota bacterium]